MAYGICNLSLVPARKEPSGTSEMVTQLVFGETYTVIGSNDEWLKIITTYDKYECWISIKQHFRLSDQAFRQLQKEKTVFVSEMVQIIHDLTTGHHFPVTIGACLPAFKDGRTEAGEFKFQFEGQFIPEENKPSTKNIISTALLLLNAPYLWGGRSPFGIDCSGFTQLVYKLNGIKLPRDAYQQVEKGTALTFVEEAEAGDLAYFDNEDGHITHVGIIMDQHQIIHASGKVRIDKFDHYGIFNLDTRRYSHSLRVIKRILP